eukprot:355239-Chlamydomonas_euryale.AAC.6
MSRGQRAAICMPSLCPWGASAGRPRRHMRMARFPSNEWWFESMLRQSVGCCTGTHACPAFCPGWRRETAPTGLASQDWSYGAGFARLVLWDWLRKTGPTGLTSQGLYRATCAVRLSCPSFGLYVGPSPPAPLPPLKPPV